MLEARRLLITGVATDDSIGLEIARRAQLMGAEVALTVFPRDRDSALDAARSLPKPLVDVIDADLTQPDDLATVTARLRDRWDGLDGAVHAVAFAPRSALAPAFLEAPSADIELAFRTSVHTYVGLAGVLRDLAPARGGSLVGLDFDGSRAWPVYNWMGVCKSALESANRYAARDLGPLGIRSNLVAAGPLRTRAASAIPGFDRLVGTWADHAPMAWDLGDPGPTADATCFLLSDLARGITGETLHVDGGLHAMAPANSV